MRELLPSGMAFREFAARFASPWRDRARTGVAGSGA